MFYFNCILFLNYVLFNFMIEIISFSSANKQIAQRSSSSHAGNVSWMLSGRSHCSPLPPGLCVCAGRWAESRRSGRRPAVLPSLRWGCIRGARGHHPSCSALFRLERGHCKCVVHHNYTFATSLRTRGHSTSAKQREEDGRADQVSSMRCLILK